MRVRPPAWLSLTAVSVALVASGCGTRLSDNSFATSNVITEQTALATESSAASPGASGSAAPVAGPSGLPLTTAAAGPTGGPTVGPTSGPAVANTASDIGVTPTTIKLGTVSSITNAFDPTAFVGPQFGAAAWVDEINRRGGIHGRSVELLTCDDHGDGGRNNQCVHQLIDNDHVFALVSNAIFSYAGAGYVQSKGVPDVGSQPISTAYDQLSHLWDLYGEAYPRNGTIGYGGQLEGGTEVYHYFKAVYPKAALKAGVVYYNQADSQRFADNITKGLEAEGYAVVAKEVNFALPDYDSAVLDMKSQGVRYVYDALDAGGNQNLCASMDTNGLSDQVEAKVTTTQSWTATIASQYDQSPTCRNKIWATGNTLNYEDTGFAQVKAFRDAMTRRHTDSPSQLSEWALEGWAGAQWLGDAIGSCGAQVTRRCVEGFMGGSTPYDGHGLLTERSFVKHGHTPRERNCLNVARWQDSAQAGRGGWVTQVKDMNTNCFDVATVLYTP